MATREMRRKKSDVVIHIDIDAAISDGIPFYRIQNGILLTEGVEGVLPCKYFLKIVNSINGQTIEEPMHQYAQYTSAELPVTSDENLLDEYMRDWIDETRDVPTATLTHGITDDFFTDNADIVYTFTGTTNGKGNEQPH